MEDPLLAQRPPKIAEASGMKTNQLLPVINPIKRIGSYAVFVGFTLSIFGALPMSAEGAESCNAPKALALLRLGQSQSVDGEKEKGIITQFAASKEAWFCYLDPFLNSKSRGTYGKASADVVNGAAQDAEAIGQHKVAISLVMLALKEYRALSHNHSLPLEIRVYADGVVQAATSP